MCERTGCVSRFESLLTIKKLNKLVLVIILFVACLMLSSARLYSANEVIKLRYADWFAPTHVHAILISQWCQEVEKRTNGKVKISHFPGGVLSPPNQVYDGVVKGVFDIGTAPCSYTTGRFPLTEVIDLPLGYASGYQATKMANEFYKRFKPKEWENVKVFYIHAHGPCFVHTKKQTTKLDEINGLRIKASGLSSKIIQALGGIPVTMPITETYDALKRGLADGILLQNEVLKTFRFGEVLKTTFINRGMSNTTALFVAMNKQKWNSLPKDVQQTIEKINDEWVEKTAKAYIELDNEGERYIITAGNTIVKATKEEEMETARKMKPILNEYVQKMEAKGLPGKEALKFCLDYLKAHPDK